MQLIDPFDKAEAGAEGGDAAIRAPMNGRLVALAVAEGDKVEAGKRLAVVEAMKMEHALVAPHAGIIRDLAVECRRPGRDGRANHAGGGGGTPPSNRAGLRRARDAGRSGDRSDADARGSRETSLGLPFPFD